MVPLKNKGGKVAILFLENNMDLVFAALNVIPQSLKVSYMIENKE
jgi:hypothetical protein